MYSFPTGQRLYPTLLSPAMLGIDRRLKPFKIRSQGVLHVMVQYRAFSARAQQANGFSSVTQKKAVMTQSYTNDENSDMMKKKCSNRRLPEEDPATHATMDWSRERNYPRPDYLSSSRKRLAPQLIYKGGILHAWHRKMAVAVDQSFFNSLPSIEEVAPEDAEMAWLIYNPAYDPAQMRYRLKREKVVYTKFVAALDKITRAEAGDIQNFVELLQERLDEKLDSGNPPDAPTLLDVIEGGEI